MSNVNQGADLVAQWRSGAGNSPAGALFIGGEFAEADIVGETIIGTLTRNGCGTACTGSRTRMCC